MKKFQDYLDPASHSLDSYERMMTMGIFTMKKAEFLSYKNGLVNAPLEHIDIVYAIKPQQQQLL